MFSNIRFVVKCLHTANHHVRVNPVVAITSIKNYCMWHHRQPAKIVNEEEILEAEAAEGPNEFLDDADKVKRKPLNVRRRKKWQVKKKIVVDDDDVCRKEDGKLNYEEVGLKDPKLALLMLSVRSRKQRDQKSKIILEGVRLIADALDAGIKPEIIVFSRFRDVFQLPLPERGVKFFKTKYSTIQTWSTLVTSPGIMGFFKMPNTEKTTPGSDSLPLTIICDNIRDPANMGSILRSVAAVGCKRLITLHGCVDIWNPKVLKTAAGAHFRTPIYANKTWDEVTSKNLIDPFADVFIADNNVAVRRPENTKINSDGDEINKEESKAEMDENEEKIESENKNEETVVNVSEEDPIEQDRVADEAIKKHTEGKEKPKYKSEFLRLKEAKVAKRLTKFIPVIPYYSADYTSNEVVIVVGGETEGISLEALELVHKKIGVRINIPMTNGVDSLNTSMALGIIAFEIKRQFAIKQGKNKTD